MRHNIFKFKTEIKSILEKEKVGVLFCTEVDADDVLNNFSIPQHDTFYPMTNKEEAAPKIRILAVAKRGTDVTLSFREDLMTCDYPSLWVEARSKEGTKFIIGGLYRE